MARIFADRVMESTVSTGTGPLVLTAAPAGYQRFRAALAIGDTCDYAVYETDSDGKPTGAWETGTGTYTAVDTLTRTTIQRSSTGTAAIAFAAGPKIVILSENAASIAVLLSEAPNDGKLYGRKGLAWSEAVIPVVYEKPQVRGAATTWTDGTGFNLTFPAGTSAGDRVFLYGASTQNPLTPSGWTELARTANLAGFIATKVLTQAEATGGVFLDAGGRGWLRGQCVVMVGNAFTYLTPITSFASGGAQQFALAVPNIIAGSDVIAVLSGHRGWGVDSFAPGTNIAANGGELSGVVGALTAPADGTNTITVNNSGSGATWAGAIVCRGTERYAREAPDDSKLYARQSKSWAEIQLPTEVRAYRYWGAFNMLAENTSFTSINEFQFRSAAGGLPIPGGTATGTPQYADYVLARAFDGGDNFYGVASGNIFIYIDYGAPVVVAELMIKARGVANETPRSGVIRGSNDGVNWVDICPLVFPAWGSNEIKTLAIPVVSTTLAIVGEAPQDGQRYVRLNGAWVVATAVGSEYIVPLFYADAPAANQILLEHIFPRQVTFPAAFGGARMGLGTLSAAGYSVSIQRNGVEVGTGAVNPDGSSTFAGGTSDIQFAAGDVLSVVVGANPDQIVRRLRLTLRGS